MNLNKAGKIALAVGLVLSLLWASAVPKVFRGGGNGRVISCAGSEDQSRCVLDTGAIALRFVMGAAVTFALALAATATVKDEEWDKWRGKG